MVPPQLKAESRNYRESSASWSSWERRRLRCPCGPPRCRPPAVRTGRLPGAGGSSCPPSVGAAGAAALPGGGPVRVAPRGFLPACLPACRCVEASRGAVFCMFGGFCSGILLWVSAAAYLCLPRLWGSGSFALAFPPAPGRRRKLLKSVPEAVEQPPPAEARRWPELAEGAGGLRAGRCERFPQRARGGGGGPQPVRERPPAASRADPAAATPSARAARGEGAASASEPEVREAD